MYTQRRSAHSNAYTVPRFLKYFATAAAPAAVVEDAAVAEAAVAAATAAHRGPSSSFQWRHMRPEAVVAWLHLSFQPIEPPNLASSAVVLAASVAADTAVPVEALIDLAVVAVVK